jgi:AraC-like DNA-binding protein
MLFTISIITIFAAILLIIFNWKQNKNSIILAILFISLATYALSHYFCIFSNNRFWIAIFYNNFSPLWLLTGPCLFFYVRNTLVDKQIIDKLELLHFIPFIFQLANILPYFFTSFQYKLQIADTILIDINNLKLIKTTSLIPPTFFYVLRPIILFLYILYSMFLLYKFRTDFKLKKNFSDKQYHIIYYWLLLLNISLLVLVINFSFLTFKVLNAYVTSDFIDRSILNYLSGVGFFSISISIFIFPQILYGVPKSINLQNILQSNEKISVEKNNVISDTKELNVNIESNEPLVELANRIVHVIENEKLFLNHDFSLTELSIKLSSPQHHLLYCFKYIINQTFTNYRAALRVAYSKELLESGITDNITIEAIGKKSGFSSKSNFYSSFKKIVGITPNEYLALFNSNKNNI